VSESYAEALDGTARAVAEFDDAVIALHRTAWAYRIQLRRV
jgi:hypothetical protein